VSKRRSRVVVLDLDSKVHLVVKTQQRLLAIRDGNSLKVFLSDLILSGHFKEVVWAGGKKSSSPRKAPMPSTDDEAQKTLVGRGEKGRTTSRLSVEGPTFGGPQNSNSKKGEGLIEREPTRWAKGRDLGGGPKKEGGLSREKGGAV